MHKLIERHDLKLLLARGKLICQDGFEGGLDGWNVQSGEWHKITIESNVDQSAGLDGNLALNCMGSYDGGIIEKEIVLNNYGEVSFEHYVQNSKNEGNNYLKFYIDDVIKLSIKGPSPWYRCEPIGLTPGQHKLKFEYLADGSVTGKKAVVDTLTIFEAKDVPCLITTYNPPKPVKNLAENQILRGYSSYQEMMASNTQIDFIAGFSGQEYHEFMVNSDKVFYFVDEFGICYRGIFNDTINPKSQALKKIYFVELILTASSKVGIGFC